MKKSLSQLLVHLDASARAGRRLEVARDIAQTHGAAVTALYAVTPALLVVPFAPEAGASVASALGKIDEERCEQARQAFERAVATPGVQAVWAQVQDYPIVPAFARQALYADLLVLGQHDENDAESAGVPFDFAETVMATSGKPALILPYAESPHAVGQTVVIAWKPTREAARAVSAVGPLAAAGPAGSCGVVGRRGRRGQRGPARPGRLPEAAGRGADLASRTWRRAGPHGRPPAVAGVRPRSRPAGDGLLWPQPGARVGARRHLAHGAAFDDLARADGALTRAVQRQAAVQGKRHAGPGQI